MLDRALADLILVLHLGFIAFAALGGLLALRWRWIPWWHPPATAWGAFIELTGGVCPLTPLENSLRASAGHAGYSGGFIEHYVLPVVYPPGLTYPTQRLMATLLILVNGAVYAWVWRHRVRGKANR